MSDWFVGGPGAHNSQQFFAGRMDSLRIYDKALSPEDISRIYNGGEGDVGIVGLVTAPVVTQENVIALIIL